MQKEEVYVLLKTCSVHGAFSLLANQKALTRATLSFRTLASLCPKSFSRLLNGAWKRTLYAESQPTLLSESVF